MGSCLSLDPQRVPALRDGYESPVSVKTSCFTGTQRTQPRPTVRRWHGGAVPDATCCPHICCFPRFTGVHCFSATLIPSHPCDPSGVNSAQGCRAGPERGPQGAI